MKLPIVSVVFGSYNRHEFIKLTVDSIRKELIGIPHEIIAIDGGSNDGALEYLLQQKDIITIVQHNRGAWDGKPIERRSWGYFMNLGFKIAQGKYICMVSDDCLVVPGAIENGCALFEEELSKGRNIGAMAFYWRDWEPRRNEYHVARVFEKYLYVNHGLYLKSALEQVGYAEEERYQFYTADMDLCLKMWQKKYEVISCPTSFIEHYAHANMKVRKTNTSGQAKDTTMFFETWWPIVGNGQKRLLGYEKDVIIYHDQDNTAKIFREHALFDVGAKVAKSKRGVRRFLYNVGLLLRAAVPMSVKKKLKHLLRR